jgi:CRISPR-associated protein Cas1
MTLHLTHQGATLRLRAGRLLLEKDGITLADFPARQVRRVALWGNVRLSTPALVFLLRQGAPVFFLSLEGFLYGVAGAFPDPHPAHLRAQFGAEALPLARAFVLGKLRSAQALLLRTAFPRPRRWPKPSPGPERPRGWRASGGRREKEAGPTSRG